MNLVPRRLPGLALGGLLLAVLIGVFAVSLSRLGADVLSPGSLIWIGLMLLALPLTLMVINRLYGLVTARYRLDRDGLYVQWGLAYEQAPIRQIRGMRTLKLGQEAPRPRLGFWWPGCLVGRTESEELGTVDFFATVGPLTLVELEAGRHLALSPSDPEAFRAGYNNARHMGELERIRSRSERPEALLSDIWSDRLARVEIVLGLAVPLALLVGLILRAPALPAEVRFGFGSQAPLVPLARLTLLPMIAGLIWLSDLLAGAWFYRSRRDRPLAYLLWGTAVIVGLLLAGAALRFVSL